MQKLSKEYVSTGAATLTATQALFSNGTVNVTVVPPILNIYNLPTSTTSLSANDPFYVRSGYLNTAGTSFLYAPVSGAADLTVTLTSSNPAVGTLVTTPLTGASVTVTIAKGNYDSPSTVATGGAAFDPLTGGATTVAATAPGTNNAYSGSAVTITVSQPTITLADSWQGDHRIGAGLEAPYTITLGGASHGGVTVRITSSDTTRFPGVPDLHHRRHRLHRRALCQRGNHQELLPPGSHGHRHRHTDRHPGARSATGTVNVDRGAAATEHLQPGNQHHQPVGADDPFYVRAGYLNSNGTSFLYARVSPAGPMHVLLTSSTPAVGQLKTSADKRFSRDCGCGGKCL